MLTGAQITAETQGDVKDGMAFFNTFLMVFAVIALFVGAFIIFNTFSIIVAQRQQGDGAAAGDRCQQSSR